MTTTPYDPQALEASIAAMPRDVVPERDLWSGIEARIAPPRRWYSGWAGQIAAAVALVAISSILTATLVRRADQLTAGEAAGGAPLQFAAAKFGPGHALNAEYAAARRQLASQLAQRAASLPPAARAKLESNLAEMHRAAQEINEALARSPGDPLLEELLLSTYQDELGVLASVNQMTSTATAGAARQEHLKL